MNILLIEDNRILAKSLVKGLQQKKNSVEHFLRGDDGEEFLLNHHKNIDVIILDIMLPGKSGLEILENIRNLEVETPVLMLTAKNTTDDIVTGFEHGADDYLAKPFEFEELVARIHALERRKPHIEHKIMYISPGLFIDMQAKNVIKNGHEIPLSPREFSILEILCKNKNIALTRDQIFDKVCDFAADNWSNTIDVHIKNMRKKLFKDDHEDPIKTVRGVGYRLEPQV